MSVASTRQHPPPTRNPPVRQGLVGDYRRHCRDKQEPARRSRLLMVPRLLTNPSLRACLLFRLCASSPIWLHWLWRSILIRRYSCDIGHGAVFGEGLLLPHPVSIVITRGVTIGRDVMIGPWVGLGGDGRTEKGPVIGDEAVILPYALILGDTHVGIGATVRAKTLLLEDLPDGAVHRNLDGLRTEHRSPVHAPES